MSVTSEDVQEAVKQLWNANATLSDASTGLVKSLIMGRVPDAATAPYATFKITESGQLVRTGTGGYLQTFTVEFKTWAEAGAVIAGAIKVAIESCFGIQARTVLTLASGRTIAILHSVKVPGALDEDETTRQGQAVKMATDRFELLCQG